MKNFLVTIMTALTASQIVLAVPGQTEAAAAYAEIDTRGNSGCYDFEDPDHCIDYTVCQCANGWFYEYNSKNGGANGCNPPWMILAKTESGLKGYCN